MNHLTLAILAAQAFVILILLVVINERIKRLKKFMGYDDDFDQLEESLLYSNVSKNKLPKTKPDIVKSVDDEVKDQFVVGYRKTIEFQRKEIEFLKGREKELEERVNNTTTYYSNLLEKERKENKQKNDPHCVTPIDRADITPELNIFKKNSERSFKEEGDICGEDGCKGTIECDEPADTSCVCHMGNPPCGHCTTTVMTCTECDYEEVHHA